MASSEKETMLPGMRALVHFWQQLSVSQWAVTVLVTLLAVLTPGPGWAGGSPDSSADAAAIIAPPTTTGTCFFIFTAEPQAHQLALRTIDPKTVVYSEANQCIIICLHRGFNAPIYDFAEAARYEFDAYGVEVSRTGTTQNRYGYSGYENVASVGSTYLRARWYDAGVGRFSSMDTYEGWKITPRTLHRFNYCHGDPATWNDPQGTSEQWHLYLPKEFADVWDRLGIKYNSRSFGVMLDEIDHQIVHGIGYNDEWEKFFRRGGRNNVTAEEVLDKLGELRYGANSPYKDFFDVGRPAKMSYWQWGGKAGKIFRATGRLLPILAIRLTAAEFMRPGKADEIRMALTASAAESEESYLVESVIQFHDLDPLGGYGILTGWAMRLQSVGHNLPSLVMLGMWL